MKVGVIIPDRGDRPQLLRNCLRMMAAQTILPAHLEVITNLNPDGKEGEPDITYKYRLGYERMSRKGVDVIAFIENDDWYAPDYLELMANEWEAANRPDLLGTAYTIYYHLKLRAHFTMKHPRRASAMNTLVKPNLAFNWPLDYDPYTDVALWRHIEIAECGMRNAELNSLRPITKHIWHPEERLGRHIAIGMKHGEGLCGGYNHTNKLHRFKFPDLEFEFLKKYLDAESLKFYTGMYSQTESIRYRRNSKFPTKLERIFK